TGYCPEGMEAPTGSHLCEPTQETILQRIHQGIKDGTITAQTSFKEVSNIVGAGQLKVQSATAAGAPGLMAALGLSNGAAPLGEQSPQANSQTEGSPGSIASRNGKSNPFGITAGICFDLPRWTDADIKALHPIARMEFAWQYEEAYGKSLPLGLLGDAPKEYETFQRMETANAMLGIVGLSAGLEAVGPSISGVRLLAITERFETFTLPEFSIVRYTGPVEARIANETGFIPNVDRFGNPKNVFVTPEPPLNSASQAESTYKIGAQN